MIGLRPARAAGSCREGLAMGFLNRLRALAALALIAVSVSACGYNVIPTKQEAANAAWAEVQNQYQRRADLVSQSGRNRSGFRQAGKGRLCPGHRGAHQGRNPNFILMFPVDNISLKKRLLYNIDLFIKS